MSAIDHVKLFEEYIPNTKEVVKIMDKGANSEYSQAPVSDMSNGLHVDGGERRDSTKLT